MSLFEQFLANTRFFAKQAVLDGQECSAIANPSKAQKKMCDSLILLEEVQADGAELEEVKKSLSAEDKKTLDRLAAQSPNSFVQTSVPGALLEERSHLERVRHVRSTTGAG